MIKMDDWKDVNKVIGKRCKNDRALQIWKGMYIPRGTVFEILGCNDYEFKTDRLSICLVKQNENRIETHFANVPAEELTLLGLK